MEIRNSLILVHNLIDTLEQEETSFFNVKLDRVAKIKDMNYFEQCNGGFYNQQMKGWNPFFLNRTQVTSSKKKISAASSVHL